MLQLFLKKKKKKKTHKYSVNFHIVFHIDIYVAIIFLFSETNIVFCYFLLLAVRFAVNSCLLQFS